MNRQSQRGIALVITLLMLAVVTVMAVVFLGISRREKSSVTATADQSDAGLMAEAALARAQAEIVSRILTSTNPFAYDMMVSTNFINPQGFQRGVAGPTNVSYIYQNGSPLNDEDDLLQNIANLQYDARVPVFVPRTNDTIDFRYYLDLNRNARFETNGWQPILSADRRYYDTNRNLISDPSRALYGDLVGDPEWIGVLSRPTLPHSETNRFIGRYAFMVLPAGRSLDVNAIHNNAKNNDTALNANNFYRNQGVGPWELNLAAFFRDLNTNSWRPVDYVYNGGNMFQPSVGLAFDDARTVLRYRYNLGSGAIQIRSLAQVFGPRAWAFAVDGFDSCSDGPHFSSTFFGNMDTGPVGDGPARSWPGSPSIQTFYDPQDILNPGFDLLNQVASQQLVRRLTNFSTQEDTYNRYTFYRLLAQLGTDSQPAISNRLFGPNFQHVPVKKLNLNYRNDEFLDRYTDFVTGEPNSATGLTNYFIPWDFDVQRITTQRPDLAANADLNLSQIAAENPTHFFYQAADRLLRASLATNINTNLVFRGIRGKTNYFLGSMPVNDDFSFTNIQIYSPYVISGDANNNQVWQTNNEYSSTLHRLLQVAVNIYDSMTSRRIGNSTNEYPTVFRPVFTRRGDDRIFITGWQEVTNYQAQLGVFWRDLDNPADRNALLPMDNVYGVPWVIGAKKGYPNFNEFVAQTVAQVSRKLLLTRSGAGPGAIFTTNQAYVLGVSNLFGIEAWNSYTQAFNRNFEVQVRSQHNVYLYDLTVSSNAAILWTNLFYTNLIQSSVWAGRTTPNAFLLPLMTNNIFLPDWNYNRQTTKFVSSNVFEKTFVTPQWVLVVTNRLQYTMLDTSLTPPRVVDFVNLDNMVSQIDVTHRLIGDSVNRRRPQVGPDRGDSVSESDVWITNRISPGSAITIPTLGIVRQIDVSRGVPLVGEGLWRSAQGDPIAADDKTKAIQAFNSFLRGVGTNLVMQAPFSPSRRVFDTRSWQVNDPLVHYTVEDLTDPVLTAADNQNFGFLYGALPATNNLGLVNERYSPWGTPRKKIAGPKDFAAEMAVKDPGVFSSDDWNFTTNKFPNIGWMGGIHRGTPWQTLYTKDTMESLANWTNWTGGSVRYPAFGTHPTNDWKFYDLFTVAPTDSAARGLLGVNQTNVAAWSAVLSGVSVFTNSVNETQVVNGQKFTDIFIQPGSPQLLAIADGIQRTRQRMPNRVFKTVGEVLATPELTTRSPFLSAQNAALLTDEAVEKIPRQIMSLLKTDDPRIVVYAFGQSLKPAPRSIVTAGNFFNLCTNYQITGEVFTKAVIRIEDAPHNPRAVVESFSVVPPQ